MRRSRSRDHGARDKSRSSSRSSSDGGRPRRILKKRSNFSSAIEPNQPVSQKMSTAEILNQYKAANPASQNVIS